MDFPSPYRNSAFQNLGLSASASLEQIEERFQILLQLCKQSGKKVSLAKTASDKDKISIEAVSALAEQDGAEAAVISDLSGQAENELLEAVNGANWPWLEFVFPSSASLIEARQALQEPESRLAQRLFWYHTVSVEDGAALELVSQGLTEKAILLWKEVGTSASAPAASKAAALHNLALLYHTRAYAVPLGKESAQADLREAARWWNRLLENKYLPFVISDGEPFAPYSLNGTDKDKDEQKAALIAAARLLVPKIYRYIPQLLSQERCRLSGGEQNEGQKILNLAKDNVRLPSDMEIRDFRETGAKIALAVEEAEYLAAHYHFQEAVQVLARTRSEVNSEEMAQLDAHIYQIELRRVVRGLMPVKDAPKLSGYAAFGVNLGRLRHFDEKTRSFSTRLSWTFFFVPLWYLARYQVRQEASGRWIFMGRFVYDPFITIYNFAVCSLSVLVLAAFFLIGAHWGISFDIHSLWKF